MRPIFLSFTTMLTLAACTSESRDRLWQTFDPAGYKHAHSEVFNPRKYRRDVPRLPENADGAIELEPLR